MHKACINIHLLYKYISVTKLIQAEINKNQITANYGDYISQECREISNETKKAVTDDLPMTASTIKLYILFEDQ